MQVEIINENDTNWTATIKFTHNDVVHEETYNLIAVIPGTDLQLKKAGISFDQTMKSNVISKLKDDSELLELSSIIFESKTYWHSDFNAHINCKTFSCEKDAENEYELRNSDE